MGIYDYTGESRIHYIDVLEYGAVGDGITDDSGAIQNALDALSQTGGLIYFPCKMYLIKTPILFYSNQTLLFDEGATILQGASMNNLMRNYSTTSIGEYYGTHDTQIIGATFDGGSFTANITLLGFCHAKNIVVKNCKFRNAYGAWHDLEVNSSQYVLIDNCKFDGSRKNGQNGENLQFDGAGSSTYYPWDDIKIDNTVCQYVEVKGCHFHGNTASPAIGNHANMAHKFVKIHDCTFDGNTGSRGAINFASSTTDIDIYNNTFNGCSIGVGTSGTTYFIHGNRFVEATTAISGTESVAHSNMINGAYIA